ncbi:MAG: hypothetical protein JNL79_21635 [Myxococcales bacterium]|nr:hypothetical protein [Myxococcales bacterium]
MARDPVADALAAMAALSQAMPGARDALAAVTASLERDRRVDLARPLFRPVLDLHHRAILEQPRTAAHAVLAAWETLLEPASREELRFLVEAPPVTRAPLATAQRRAPQVSPLPWSLDAPLPEPDEPGAEETIPERQDVAEPSAHPSGIGRNPGPPPMSLATFHARVLEELVDRVAMLANHRATLPVAELASRDAQLRAQLDAFQVLGPARATMLLDLHARTLDDPDPQRPLAFVLLLGTLAGSDALAATERVIRALPNHGPRALRALRAVGEGLFLSPHPGVIVAAQRFARADRAALRGAALECLLRTATPSLDDLADALVDPEPVVVATALRALCHVPEVQKVPEIAVRLLDHPDPEVAFQAARTTTLFGLDEARLRLRSGAGLTRTLGERAVTILALTGELSDVEAVEAIVRRLEPTPSLLGSLGRFGNPRVASFLLHYLAREELREAAHDALVTLFGPRLEGEAALDPAAWRASIQRLAPDPQVRLRRGAPHSPAAVAAEIGSRALDRAETALRLDELMVEVGRFFPSDLTGWTPSVERVIEMTTSRFAREVGHAEQGR